MLQVRFVVIAETKKIDLKLSNRVYECESCHTKIDRDYNAGINLKQYGIHALQELGVMTNSLFCVVCIGISVAVGTPRIQDLVTWSVSFVDDLVIKEKDDFFRSPHFKH